MSPFKEMLGIAATLLIAVIGHFLYEWRRADRMQTRIDILEKAMAEADEAASSYVTIPYCQLQHHDLSKLLDTKFEGTEKRLDSLALKVDALLEIARNGRNR